jgi:hypothetical protein
LPHKAEEKLKLQVKGEKSNREEKQQKTIKPYTTMVPYSIHTSSKGLILF